MGRSERPIDGDLEPVCRFAGALRELRRRAGSPTYRQMSARVHYSPSVLSQAASGRALPTLPVTVAFVEACGEDPEPWVRRWRAAAAAVHATGSPVTPAAPEPTGVRPDPILAGPEQTGALPVVEVERSSARLEPTDRPGSDTTARRPRRRPAAVWYVGVVAAVLVAVGAWRFWPSRPAGALARPASSTSSVRPSAPPRDPVVDGADPERSGCAADGVTVDRRPLVFPAGRLAGTVELRYSPRCRMGWTRFTPAPASGRGPGDTVTVQIVRPSDGVRLPFTMTYGDLAVYGDILSTEHGCVRAEVSVVTDGHRSPVVATGCHTGLR